MKTAKLFRDGESQAVRLPKNFEFEDVSELEITTEGDTITLRPVRKSWISFAEVEKANSDFLNERPNIIEKKDIAF